MRWRVNRFDGTSPVWANLFLFFSLFFFFSLLSPPIRNSSSSLIQAEALNFATAIFRTESLSRFRHFPEEPLSLSSFPPASFKQTLTSVKRAECNNNVSQVYCRFARSFLIKGREVCRPLATVQVDEETRNADDSRKHRNRPAIISSSGSGDSAFGDIVFAASYVPKTEKEVEKGEGKRAWTSFDD